MKNKKVLITIIFIILISLLGVTYAFFEYYGISADYEVKAGAVTLTLNEGKDYIDLTNIFPETKEEARLRDDNIISFTISGVNTTENKDIYYEIMLNEGDEVEGLTRFLPKELMFDLTEINPDGTEKLVVDNMNFGDFNATRIWVNTILRENETEFTRTYELRMWLSDKVLISDTYEGADYTTSEFRQRYASVRVSVFGDFNEKSAPYNYLAKINTSSSAFWPTAINNVRSSISEVNFVSLPQSEIDARYEAATIKEDVTDTTKGGSVLTWLETDTTDETKYIMYVASDGITYFPNGSNYMFYSFTNLKEINFANVNTNKVTDMSNMFQSCSSLVGLDVSNFDTSAATDMSSMFSYCSSLTSLDLSNFNTSRATDISGMFAYCKGLTSIDVSKFDTSQVTDMSAMFADCKSLTGLDLSNFDTSEVTDIVQLFRRCSKLISLDLSNFDTGNVTDMNGMFNECSSLTSLDVSGFDTSAVTDMSEMFRFCSSLTTLDVSNFDTSNVTDMLDMFYSCSSLTNLDLSNFDTSQVTRMSSNSSSTGMFYGCKSLTSLDVSSFDTSQVTNMSSMFSGCRGLTSLDVSGFDTSAVMKMSSMFSGCSGLTSLDVSGFDTESVTNMSSMFSGCSGLTSLDVSNFDTNLVTNMSYMFYNCSNLTTIYANTDWNTGKVTSSSFMFSSCSKLVGAVPYDKNKTDITMANPTTGYFTVKPTEETPTT